MRLFNRRQFSIIIASGLLITGAYMSSPPVHAWNPFHKADPDDLNKPPPGLTEVEDEDTSDRQTENEQRGYGHKQEETKAATAPKEEADQFDNDPDFHLRAAKRLAGRQRYKEALLQVNKVLELNKNCWEARYLGAYILQCEGRFPEAITRYRQYLAVKKDDIQAHINLGVVLRHENKFDESEDEYRKAIALNFYSLEAHYDLANLLIGTDALEDALKELLVCAKFAPTNALVHNNLGVIYQKRDYPEEAEQEFSKAANLEPANRTFSLNLDLAREQLQHKREASTGKQPM